MRRWMMALCLAMLLWGGACAAAEGKVYAYGGSGRDELTDITAGSDGRILMTGYTESADGTLSDRTKTGRSGWALCVDEQGNVLWNFCSRSGEDAWMACPVFHEDGSATVLLYTGMEGVELIRLDGQGKDVMRRTLYETGMNRSCYAVITPRGYLIGAMNRGKPAGSVLYDWNGEQVAQSDYFRTGMDVSVRGAVIHTGERDGAWLMRQTQAGVYENFVPLTDDMELSGVERIRSASDGGGLILDAVTTGDGRMGRVMRWDNSGVLRYDMVLTAGETVDAQDTQKGLYVLCRDGFAYIQVLVLDGEGIEQQCVRIAQGEGLCAPVRMAVLPDGRAAVLGVNGLDARYADPALLIVDWNE